MPSRRDAVSLLGRGALGLTLLPLYLRRAGAETPVAAAGVHRGPGMAMHGEPRYKPNFTHFDYVNPRAPKGGAIFLGAAGTFDNLNPFILKGTRAGAISGLSFDHLMKRSADEPFTMYALVANEIEVPSDRSWVVFHLTDRARFHDDTPLAADDVVFSIDTLLNKGHPFYRQYFHDVAKAERIDARTVKFHFKPGENRELPLIIAGDLPILSKAYWASRDFEQVSLEAPLGSGPYKLREFIQGRYLLFDRVKNYWAADLPVNRGYSNFDVIRIDYFRDATIAREAFKAGEFDYRAENQATAWATAYNTDAVRDGLMQKQEVKHIRPAGMQAFVFNARKPMFRDWRVRRALTLVFDFEWTNKNLFYSQYVRSKSYFANSEMAATGVPEGDELKVLEPFKGRVPDSVFAEPYAVRVYAGDGNIRDGVRQALGLLKDAGWDVRDTKLAKNGEPFEFEVLSESPQFERIYLPFVQNLKRLGIAARLRLVDTAQYVKRVEAFDFDMITDVWGQSESPGNEQRDMWGSVAADTNGSRNTIGIKDKAIDELIELVIRAPDRVSLVARTKALDRVLLHHHFVVPGWHVDKDRLVYWDKFGISSPHRRGTSTDNWWYDAAKAERLKGRIRSLR